jgi:hypothetical protein
VERRHEQHKRHGGVTPCQPCQPGASRHTPPTARTRSASPSVCGAATCRLQNRTRLCCTPSWSACPPTACPAEAPPLKARLLVCPHGTWVSANALSCCWRHAHGRRPQAASRPGPPCQGALSDARRGLTHQGSALRHVNDQAAGLGYIPPPPHLPTYTCVPPHLGNRLAPPRAPSRSVAACSATRAQSVSALHCTARGTRCRGGCALRRVSFVSFLAPQARQHALTRAAHSSVRQAAAGVDNTQRRKWDKEEYEAKAAERRRLEVRACWCWLLQLHACRAS